MEGNSKKGKSEQGVVLLIVLIVVAILTTLVVDFIYFTQVDMEISTNVMDEIKAEYTAKSGVYVMAGAIKNKSLEELTEVADVLGDQSGDSEGYWTIKIPSFPLGDESVSVTVVDERSKINLNALVDRTTNRFDRQVRAELTELFRFLGVDNNKSSLFIGSLINWLDRPVSGSQNDQDPTGAKGEFYEGLENPYHIKDGPLDSLEEIRLVAGMDDEFFSKISNYVTVYPGDKKINFSTAPRVVMMAALKAAAVSGIQGQQGGSPDDVPDDIAESIAEAVIEKRKDNPVVNRGTVSHIVQENYSDILPKISAGLSGLVSSTGKSDVFSVTSTGGLGLGEENPTIKTIRAVIRKSASENSQGVNIISWKEQ